jgi:hypothetical protein
MVHFLTQPERCTTETLHMPPRVRQPSVSRPINVGWFLDVDEAGAMYPDPIPIAHLQKKVQRHKKSPDYCPAVQSFNRNLFVLLAPYDLTLFCNEKPDSFEFRMETNSSSISPGSLRHVLFVTPPLEWRSPNRPVIQLRCPYVFVSDDNVTVEQTAPWLHYHQPTWPGVAIAGAFEIRNWVRPLSWAFEWYELSRPLVIRSGEPWSYVRLIPASKSVVKLARIERTSAIADLQKQVTGITNYTSNALDLISRVEARRPARLLPKPRNP